MKKYFVIIAFFVLCLDQVGKGIVSHCLEYQSSIPILGSFFKLTYVQNEGAAWSLFSGNRVFLILVAIVALIGIYYYLNKGEKSIKIECMVGLLYGGILGNLIDRIWLGYVIDYFDFNLFGYNFPVFNIADICIVLAAFGILIEEWRHDKRENMDCRI